MSNKIALATIQFRADAKGANVALDTLKAKAAEAHRTVDDLEDAMKRGVKTMKDANGVEFDVATKFRNAEKDARSFDKAVRELIKGATALEAVVGNIRLGEIEKSSRAELKGAINAAEARKRSVRETDPEDLQQQRELNQVIEESRKQLNRLDRDTAKVIETLQNGGTVADAVLNKEIKGLQEILTMIPKGTKEWQDYNAQLKQMEGFKATAVTRELEQSSKLLTSGNLGKYSEEQIRAAISAGKELLATYKTASPEAQKLAQSIVAAEQHLKNYGVEAARLAAKEAQQIKTQEEAEKQLQITMNKRLRSLTTLSADALAESKKYWQAQMDGAEQGTAAFNKAAAALKKIEGQEHTRKFNGLNTILGDPSKFGISEVRQAVQEMERLRDSVAQGTPHWHKYNNALKQGKEYLDQLARTEAADKVAQQMDKLNNLSATGLQEVKKYWEAMVAGADRGSAELTTYEQKLKEVTAEEQRRTQLQARQNVGILGGNLSNYSEAQIRQAIEAGNQLIKTYQTGSNEARNLGMYIVAAENHLKQYGVEAARTAQREKDALKRAADERANMNQDMIAQLNDTRNLTPEILKQQEQYWQKLINDPKSAGDSLKFYKQQLEQVKRLQEAMMQGKGQAALNFFRGDTSNASANQLKEQAEALKKYRDSLPRQANAAIIQEIDGYLAKVGKTAKTAAEEISSEMMSTEKAMTLSANAGKSAFGMSKEDAESLNYLKEDKKFIEEQMKVVPQGSKVWQEYNKWLTEVNVQMHKLPFSSTTEDLKKAQQALEQAIATTDKGTPKYDRLRMALSRIKAEMAGAGISAQKAQEVLANPRAEKSVETLKAAVARARAEMDVMGQRAERLKRLIEIAGQDDNTKKRLDVLQKELKETEQDMEQLAKSTKDADQAQKELANTSKGTASSFEKAWSRLKTYITLYVGAAMAMQKVAATMGDLMELSDKMGEVRKTTGFTADEVGRLSDNLKKLDTRTTITGLLDLSAAAGQLGLKTEEDVEGFTIAANKLMVALPEMGKEGATQMLKVALATGEIDKIRKQMEQGIIQGSSATAVAMEKVGSTIDRLRATSAATAPAITDFVKRVGAVGAQSGISIDQVAALGSTVDALGMRVEMSATALSRMIPAIKNNAFDVAKAIGVTPDTLRNLFDTGRGMEAILMIFQHIKDAGMDENSVESMLGMGNMKEIMKELNQQGARAGIVFAGLSQNVDTLREHLATAATAYEENIAIQQEYDKMNETTAAKWERLKNEIEKMFVGDQAQRWLGGIITGLRTIVDLVQSLHRSFLVLLVVLGTYKAGLGEAMVALWKYVTNIGKSVESAKKWFSELNKANLWGAIAAGALAAAYAIYNWIDSLREAAKEAAKFENELIKEQMKVNNLTESIGKARAKTEEANKEVDKAQKTFDAAKKSLDGTRESTEKLTKAETDLIEKQEKQRNAMAEHKRLIESFNSEYSKYLGFMLSEIASDLELAQARELVNDKLRETITLKRKEAALGRVEEKMGESRDNEYANLWDFVRRKATTNKNGKEISDPTKAARVMNALTKATQTSNDEKVFREAAKKIFQANGIANYDVLLGQAADYFKEVDKIRTKSREIEQQFAAEESVNREQSQKDLKLQYDAAIKNYDNLQTKYAKATGEAKKKAAANLLKQMDSINEMVDNSGTYFDRTNAQEDTAYKNFIKNSEARVNDMQKKREALLKEAGNAYNPRKTVGGGETTFINNNPWGSNQPGESTDYKDMNAEVLVNRRKQMRDFVNAIQTDSDVKAVLAEDKALKKAIEGGMSSDMRTVIEWYNTERLKIQDELHARHLTNTGDWMDPKKSKARKKRLQDDMKAYLEELDAYYTDRKSRIDQARNDEEISEAEAWNRDIKNEAEWHRRRAELQIMYSKRAKEITAEEQQAIAEIIAERTGDEAKFIKATIDKTVKFSEAIRDMNEQGAKEYRKFQGDLDLGSEKDYNKVEKALGKHLKAMEDIINKERPFNGIVDSLQDNLGKMGILTADLGDDAKSAADELVRLTFLMGEAEKAYTMTVDQLLEDMRQHGFKEWADVISKDPNMQQGLLAMLRQTFDSVQDAIKKESGIIKKHVENMLIDVTEAAQAEDTRLQILQNSVSRANSLIGAGAASERVADKLAIKQIQLQIDLQETRIRMLQKRGADAVALLRQEADLQEKSGNLEKAKQIRMDAENIDKSVGLTLTKEQVELDKQRVALSEKLEESQNRLYTSLREWADLLSSSLQGVFEATHAGDAEYYNELAKLNLTGKGGPGAGTYIVIDNEGTENAEAHYEYLDERAALERQHEIERQNAQAEAWRKVMDDINAKMNEQITDWMNAYLQNASIDMNTTAVDANTVAITGLTEQLSQGIKLNTEGAGGTTDTGTEFTNDKQANYPGFTEQPETQPTSFESTGDFAGDKMMYYQQVSEAAQMAAQAEIDASNQVRDTIISNTQQQTQVSQQGDKKIQAGTQSMFAKMTAAANLYGIAYQAMSNDNLSTTQKFEMIAVQAAGQAAISALTASLAQNTGQVAADTPAVASKTFAQLGPIAGPAAFAAITALLGGLLGFAVSKIAKSKSQIAQVTGASASVGRLTTGMQTYAEGNVNEFSDPASLTPGRSYNVDAADGRTYRAKYTGANPGTHLTNGPEFHLAGEKGREMIIDAGTTRQITMNENEIWQAIKTLSGGGRITSSRRRGRGVHAFAEGNVEDFDTATTDSQTTGMGFDPAQLQQSIDRQSDLLERALTEGIKGVFDVYGPNGLVASYDKGKKNATRHGERY